MLTVQRVVTFPKHSSTKPVPVPQMCFVHPPRLYLPPWAGRTAGQIWTCLGVGNWFDLLAVSRWLLWIVLWNKAVLMVNQVEERCGLITESLSDKREKTCKPSVLVWISVRTSVCNLCDHALFFLSVIWLIINFFTLMLHGRFAGSWMKRVFQTRQVQVRPNRPPRPQRLQEEIWCQVHHLRPHVCLCF